MKRLIAAVGILLLTATGLTAQESTGQDTELEADKLFLELPDEETFFDQCNILYEHERIKEIRYALNYLVKGSAIDSNGSYFDYSYSINNYAGYTTLCHSNYDMIPSTYSYSDGIGDMPYNIYYNIATDLASVLNDPDMLYLVELKAMALLIFDHAAQKCTDTYGAIPYIDMKRGKKSNPYAFDNGEDIYKAIINNIDDIIEVFDNFKSRPEWYTSTFYSIVKEITNKVVIPEDIDTWKRYAASLKLRMAMNYRKFDSDLAKKWAEEAIASGVIDCRENEMKTLGQYSYHPLWISSLSWNESKANASYVSILSSLKHPLLIFFCSDNRGEITNSITGEKLPANTRIVGLRAGIRVPKRGDDNPFGAASSIACDFPAYNMSYMPIYLMKWAEVDFLRAEGALYGWNMGGTAQEFYERGIRNAEPAPDNGSSVYRDRVDEYLRVESPVAYKHIDAYNPANDIESVTKIGVKWNDSDSRETKLEKIITQKYIAIFPEGYVAWTDLRRTGYPKLFPVLNPEDGDGSLKFGDLIRRQRLPGRGTPEGLDDINTTGIPALGGPDLMATRVFWDVETPNFPTSIDDITMPSETDVQLHICGSAIEATAASPATAINLVVYTVQGSRLSAISGRGSVSIDTGAWQHGVYIIKANGKTMKFTR